MGRALGGGRPGVRACLRGPPISGRGFQPFQGFAPDFSGDHRPRGRECCGSTGRALVRGRPGVRACLRGPPISGRGFNLFKALRRIFRATLAHEAANCGFTGRALVRGRPGVLARPQGPPISGRGFNLFKMLRRIFRASAARAVGRSGVKVLQRRLVAIEPRLRERNVLFLRGCDSNRCRVGWVCIDLAGGCGWRGWS